MYMVTCVHIVCGEMLYICMFVCRELQYTMKCCKHMYKQISKQTNYTHLYTLDSIVPLQHNEPFNRRVRLFRSGQLEGDEVCSLVELLPQRQQASQLLRPVLSVKLGQGFIRSQEQVEGSEHGAAGGLLG